MLLTMLVAASITASAGTAATGSTVVGATVPSATTIDVVGCPSNSPDVSSFGTVMPGSSVRTSLDCTISFGSSNDTARLRIAQQDATGTAMNRIGWTSSTTGIASEIRRVEMATALVGYATSSAGRVLKTTDGAATWSLIDIPGDGDPWYPALRVVDANTVWVAGGSGSIWQTTNGGTNWTQFAAALTTEQFDAIDVSGQVIVASGSGSTTVYSRNGGASWSSVANCSCSNYAAAALDDGTMLTGGNNWGVRRSTDGGSTWATIWNPGGEIEAFHRAGNGVTWVVGENGLVGRSDDSGSTWTNVSIATTSHLEGIVAFGEEIAFVGGRSATEAWLTVDSGTTWTPIPTGAANGIMDVGGVSVDRLVTVGQSGNARRIAQDQPIPDYAPASADWVAGTSTFGACLASVGAGATTDGTTWTRDLVGTPGDCLAANAEPWNAIGAAPSSIALAPATTTNATASIRFGLRTAVAQPAGQYIAHVAFEVVAPS